MLLINSDTTELIAVYNGHASKMIQVFSSSVGTAYSHPTRSSHLFIPLGFYAVYFRADEGFAS